MLGFRVQYTWQDLISLYHEQQALNSLLFFKWECEVAIDFSLLLVQTSKKLAVKLLIGVYGPLKTTLEFENLKSTYSLMKTNGEEIDSSIHHLIQTSQIDDLSINSKLLKDQWIQSILILIV